MEALKVKASIPLRHVQAPKKVLRSNRQKFQSHYLLTRDTRLLITLTLVYYSARRVSYLAAPRSEAIGMAGVHSLL
jgi:hypothetical protein